MRLKRLAGMALAFAVCANSFAMDIYNGRLISHTESLNENPTATFNEMAKKGNVSSNRLRKRIKENSNNNEWIDINVGIYDHDGVIHTTTKYTEMKGFSNIFIYNGDARRHVYTIETGIGCGLEPSVKDVVSLEAGGRLEIQRQPRNIISMDIPGSIAYCNLYTSVTREDSQRGFSSSAFTTIEFNDYV